MAKLKTTRPFQERFLDGFDRSQLRQEIQKVKPKRFGSLRKRYATLALGGALALGGIGVPLKMVHSTSTNARREPASPIPTPEPPTTGQIAGDLKTAEQIAGQVAGGVQGALSTVASTAISAPAQVAQQVEKAPQAMAQAAKDVVQAPVKIAEEVKAEFFQREV